MGVGGWFGGIKRRAKIKRWRQGLIVIMDDWREGWEKHVHCVLCKRSEWHSSRKVDNH